MKKLFTLILGLFLLVSSYSAQAQDLRYYDEVFDEVDVTPGVSYGVNATILLLGSVGQAVPQNLRMDLYTPKGDTETARPVILYFHTGNFLPFPQNGSTSGTRTDSTCVEFCTKLAKRGFVVASVSYRLGWSPTSTDKQTRVFTLINAAYRGVQDARTCIRFFKKTANEDNNPYGIDPDKITLWGQGTGGYLTLNTTALDDYIKIPTASNGKFIAQIAPGVFIPMVVESINGDINGTSVGIVPPGYIPPFIAGDTLCYPNWAGYDSDFKLSVNMGGALADSAWIDPGQPAVISIHAPHDKNAPYKQGIVIVPIPGNPLDVVSVEGSYIAVDLSNQNGNNDAFNGKDYTDGVSASADAKNDGIEGLFPIYGDGVDDSSPWDFWAATNPGNTNGLLSNPNMSKAKATLYIDSIITYVLPRACYVLDLGCAGVNTNTQIQPTEVGLKYGPNPASTEVLVSSSSKYLIKNIYVYDMTGRLVKAQVDINNNQHVVKRGNLLAGIYNMVVSFESGQTTQQIIFN